MNTDRTTDRLRKGFQLVTFALGAENYGIHISKVREILRPLDVFPVPGMGKDVEGVINLRGEIIPIVRMDCLVGRAHDAQPNAPRKRRVIIIEAAAGSFGFSVDEVLEVARIRAEEIQAPPEIGSRGAQGTVVTGIVKTSGRMVVCIDPEKLIPNDLMAKELAIGR